jgi:hypothetical protein
VDWDRESTPRLQDGLLPFVRRHGQTRRILDLLTPTPTPIERAIETEEGANKKSGAIGLDQCDREDSQSTLSDYESMHEPDFVDVEGVENVHDSVEGNAVDPRYDVSVLILVNGVYSVPRSCDGYTSQAVIITPGARNYGNSATAQVHALAVVSPTRSVPVEKASTKPVRENAKEQSMTPLQPLN